MKTTDSYGFSKNLENKMALGRLDVTTGKKVHTYRKCPVCGCTVAKELFPVNLYVEDMGLPNCYSAVQCDYCGMCYANTTATKEDYERYYSKFNYYGCHPGGVKSEVYLRQETIADILKQYSDPEQNIVDIGFGRGELLEKLRERGFTNISGMDPSEESVQMLQEKGIHGFCGSIFDPATSENEGKFDVAIMTEVMEHLLFPQQAIQNLKMLLRGEGYVILSIPLYEDLSQYHLSLLHLIHHEHINFFSATSFRFFMELNGFCEIELKKEHREYGEINQSVTYGAVGIYRYVGENKAAWKEPYKDQETGRVLKEYFQKQTIQLKEKFAFLEQFKRDQKPVAVWGVGGYLRQIWFSANLFECNVSILIDGSKQKQGMSFCGRKIAAPQAIENFEGTLLITALGYEKEILNKVQELGFHGEIRVL